MYFAAREGGFPGVTRLWSMRETGRLFIHSWNEVELARASALMSAYSDTPMDFADASIVAAAETLDVTQVFTLDRHFFAYVINNKSYFTVIP
jgi:hypothetical protein